MLRVSNSCSIFRYHQGFLDALLLADGFLGSLGPDVNQNPCPSLETVNKDSLTMNTDHLSNMGNPILS
jgi:hypothetical protein